MKHENFRDESSEVSPVSSLVLLSVMKRNAIQYKS